ncbi:hypothetical protein HYC85_009443 [Camellia sinensis]|uniref:Reverse transcriptase Ty1/copia-type domain-containing protein n=1 Tax=Camellia sinensis TaxID=4442 RepID=A0A7J7HFM4_CAMSI|nr:hypothetical protein HYC85_009443 [Camellia sinensis]
MGQVDTAANVQPENVAVIWNLRGILNPSWHRIQIHEHSGSLIASNRQQEGGVSPAGFRQNFDERIPCENWCNKRERNEEMLNIHSSENINKHILYKQAPRAWFAKFSSTIHDFGFSSSAYDSTLFIRKTERGTILLLLYVDDMIITSDDTVAKYTSDLLARAGLTDFKTAFTPVDLQARLTPLDVLSISQVTRPDIAYAIHIVSQFMAAPCSPHYDALLQDEVILSDAERLRMTQTNVKLLKGSGAELSRRVQNLLTMAHVQANGGGGGGGSIYLLGSTKIHDQSLADMQEVLQQQTEAIARLSNVLKRDIRDTRDHNG